MILTKNYYLLKKRYFQNSCVNSVALVLSSRQNKDF